MPTRAPKTSKAVSARPPGKYRGARRRFPQGSSPATAFPYTPQVSIFTQTSQQPGSGDVTITVPAGGTSDVAIITWEDGNGPSSTNTPGVSAGWTMLTSQNLGLGTTCSASWYKVYTTSGSDTVTVSGTAAGFVDGVLSCIRISGVNTSNPIVDVASLTTTVGSTIVTSAYQISEGNLSLLVGANDFTNQTWTGPAGWTEVSDSLAHAYYIAPTVANGLTKGSSGPTNIAAQTLTASNTGTVRFGYSYEIVAAPQTTNTNASVNPSTLLTTSSFSTPTLSSTAAVSPTTLTTTSSFNAPTVTASATVTSTTLLTTSSFNTPTVTTTANVTSTTLTTASSFNTPTVSASADVTSTTLVTTSSFNTPTVTSITPVNPSTLVTTSSFNTPSVSVNNTATSLVTTSSFNTPTLSATASVTPSTLTTTSSFNAPTISSTASVTTTTLTTVSSFNTPTVTSDSSLTASTLTTVSSFDTPSVTTGGTVVNPSTLLTVSSFTVAVVTASADVNPSTLVTVSTFGASVSGGTTTSTGVSRRETWRNEPWLDWPTSTQKVE